jgi:hypothetical protein
MFPASGPTPSRKSRDGASDPAGPSAGEISGGVLGSLRLVFPASGPTPSRKSTVQAAGQVVALRISGGVLGSLRLVFPASGPTPSRKSRDGASDPAGPSAGEISGGVLGSLRLMGRGSHEGARAPAHGRSPRGSLRGPARSRCPGRARAPPSSAAVAACLSPCHPSTVSPAPFGDVDATCRSVSDAQESQMVVGKMSPEWAMCVRHESTLLSWKTVSGPPSLWQYQTSPSPGVWNWSR